MLAIKFLVATLVAVLQFVPAQAPISGRSTIQGVVVDAGTGEVLPQAVVQLADREFETTSRLDPARRSVAAVTDDRGRFVLVDVEAGDHHLAISRNGYVRMEYGSLAPGQPGTPFSLSLGETLDVTFQMQRAARIAGRIYDEQGRPMVGAEVTAVQVSGDPDVRSPLNVLASTKTNDLGEYRLFWLTPGDYLVSARRRAMASVADDPHSFFGPQRSRNIPPNRDYQPLFFPGTADYNDARTITLGAGDTVTGIDIRLSRYGTFPEIGVASPNPDPGSGKPAPPAAVVAGRQEDDALYFSHTTTRARKVR